MILIVTNKTDYTADFLILELQRRRIEYVRFNTEDFPLLIEVSLQIEASGEVNGWFSIYGQRIEFTDIQSIWYRRPLSPTFPEAMFDASAQDFIITESRYTLDSIWRILPGFWVSHPDKLRSAETKAHQLIVAAKLGLLVPDTLITTSAIQLKTFYDNHRRDIIYKPQRHAQVDRDGHIDLIYTSLVTQDHAKSFSDVKYVPSLFQTHIPKSSELRITVVGNRVFTVQIHSQENSLAQSDWRRASSTELRHTPYDLPEEIAQRCVALVQSYDLVFGAIDMILTPSGDYIFLEVNPNGQWAWIEQMCPEIRICDALVELLISQGNRS